MTKERFGRQILFAPFGKNGQKALARSRIVVVGCGALGTNIVNLLLRAGAGFLRIVDRDVVEISNLHRQVLYDERDAAEGLPKSLAVARHASAVNSACAVEAHVADLTPRNATRFLSGVDLIMDGTDNVETRYLINDFAVKSRLPWIYGGAVGSTSVSMTFTPDGPCLRCLWPDPPEPGTLPTCDTAGILPFAPALAASLQVAAVMRLMAGIEPSDRLLQVDAWDHETASIRVPRNPDCVTCGGGKFEFLESKATSVAASLCGRNAVQINPPFARSLNLESLALRLEKIGAVERKGYYLEATVEDVRMLIFPDGRVMVMNTADIARARSLVSRYVGS